MSGTELSVVIRQLEVPLGYGDGDVAAAVAKRLRCRENELGPFRVLRRSLDARAKRSAPAMVLQVEVDVPQRLESTLGRLPNVELAVPDQAAQAVRPPAVGPPCRPVVVGAGPAGLMAALHLAEAGLNPILIERGGRAEERAQQVAAFWRSGNLDPESNTLFGEGGAGLFSDGKLTARSKDRPRVRRFCETLVSCGAPADILMDAEPHLGSDKLLEMVPRLRSLIADRGGEVRYRTRLDDVCFEGNRLAAIVAGGETIETHHLVLAVGHSARDVYRLLARRGVTQEAKPFAVGVRLELPQVQIDRAQYGRFAGHPQLRPASFKLTRKPENDVRACYSFCMCPGGVVIACAHEPGMLTTNGMSYSSRDGLWGNAAFIVPVQPDEFRASVGDVEHAVLAGLQFQEAIEKAAYQAGGGGFSVPAVRLIDFLTKKTPTDLPENRSCSMSQPADIAEILPGFVVGTLRSAIPRMLRELNGSKPDEVTLYAAETRSSSPIRMVRDEQCRSVSHPDLYPAGEGAGYAGGIVSSAVDGLKAAEMLVRSLGPDAS